MIGLLLQLVGTVVTIWGLYQTWGAYATEPLIPAWHAFSERLGRLGARVWAAFQRGRAPRPKVEGHGAVGFAGGLVAEAVVEAALPEDPGQAAAELAKRLDATRRLVRDIDQEWRKAIDQIRTDLGLGLAKEAADRARQVREAATSGAKVALLGLMLIFVGVGLQLVAVVASNMGLT